MAADDPFGPGPTFSTGVGIAEISYTQPGNGNRQGTGKNLVSASGFGSMREENLFPLKVGDHGFGGQKSLIHHFGGMIRVAILLQEEDFAGILGL